MKSVILKLWGCITRQDTSETTVEEAVQEDLPYNIDYVSEPVLSFVETVKRNPVRFKLRVDGTTHLYKFTGRVGNHIGSTRYKLLDLTRNEKFEIIVRGIECREVGIGNLSYPCVEWLLEEHSDNISFLTYNEIDYLLYELKDTFKQRFDRLERINDVKRNKQLEEQRQKEQAKRQKYIDIYCNS